ncbi:DegV family protein [Paenibacillus gallinarum]|uniref:DegV family protein n=1 Tax=Paenibacillus gallinarum TaxID=2762232 RepID=A0ABR8SWK4_9BACL|nr:DegV family protein [Paenibacillus gallinarum]MBD7967863.1 DegV family protein [Paenibacillus gallinarum]
MSQVFIVTDSTADIPDELVAKYQIHVVPLRVVFDQETYLDGIELSPATFYEKLGNAKVLPSTSQPSPVEFMNVYSQILNEHPGSQIVSIHLSSGMSGTYQSALLGKSMLEDEQTAEITVIDSKSASYGYGLLVVHAAQLAQAGKNAQEIEAAVLRLHQQRKLYFLVDTLEYLQKGGRIGKASAVLGTLLNIKPVLSIDDEGIIYAVEKIRGQKKAMERIIQMFEQDFAGKRINIAVGHTANPASAEAFISLIQTRFELGEVVYPNIGAVVGTHVGFGTIAVFVWPA